jgi:hypothetical protein
MNKATVSLPYLPALLTAWPGSHSEDYGIKTTGLGESRVVDGGVTATGVLSRERGNLITISITLY